MTPHAPLSDDDLGALLRDTFATHEHLADPERAVEIAASPGRRRRLGPALLGAAAAVALVAGGTTYAVSQGSGTGRPDAVPRSASPSSGRHLPPLPPPQTDAANEAAAARAASRAAAGLPVFRGARETSAAGVPQLGDSTLSSVHPVGHTVVRSRFWTVSGTTASAVAHWYAAHAPAGFHSGGRSSVGGQGDGTRWIYEVYYTQPGANQLTGSGTSVELETTKTAEGTGVRATVSTVWLPARPVTSFVQDVSSIDVESVHVRYGGPVQRTRQSFTVSAPGRVLRAATAFNALPGMTPIVMHCPMIRDQYTDRIVFHTATGDVTAVNRTGSCGFGMVVRREGARVDPQLGDASSFLRALGLDH